jgi:hypothetical protein
MDFYCANCCWFAKPLAGWDFPLATLGLLSLPGGGLPDRRLWQPELRILPASAILPGEAYQLKLA